MTTDMLFKVDGTAYNTDSVTVKSSIGDYNSTGNFKAVLQNPNGLYDDTFSIGDAIEILADKNTDPPTTVIFTGTIETIKHKGKSQTATITLSGRDNMANLINALVEPEVYNDTEASLIVDDLIDKYGGGVTRVNVDVSATTISNLTFNNISVFDALKKIAEQSNFYFYVDTDNDLHFKEKETTASGHTLDNNNIISSNFTETSKELYNNVFVYGDRVLSGWENNFVADGAGSVFTLDYKPHNTTITASGVIQKGGILNILEDTPSGVNYLLDYNSKKIVFISGASAGNNIPGSLSPIVAEYDRNTPIIKFGRNQASETLYGKRTKVINDSSIKDPLQAKEVLLQTLNEFSIPRKQGDITLGTVVALTAGNTIIVNLPNSGVANKVFEILEVSYKFNNDTIQSDQVLKIKVSKKLLDVTDTLKDILNQLKQLQSKDISSSDVITRLEQDYGESKIRVKEWFVTVSTIGNAFVIGGAVNGILGSPQLSSGGDQLVLGSGSAAPPLIISGGESTVINPFPIPWGTWGAEPTYN